MNNLSIEVRMRVYNCGGIIIHSAGFELASLGLRHDVVNIPLDNRGRGLVKQPLSVHTLQDLLSVTVLLLHSRSMLSLPLAPMHIILLYSFNNKQLYHF